MFGRIFWKLFLGNAVLMAAMLLTCVWIIIAEVDKFSQEDLTRTLSSQAQLVRHLIGERLDRAQAARLQEIAREIGPDDPSGMRLSIIAADGVVLADSQADPSTMESHNDRREIRDALRDGWGQETRLSHTLNRSMKYVAVRVGPAEAPVGTVRMAMPLNTFGQRTGSMRRLLWTIAAVALATAMFLALALARLWSRPIRRIMLTARDLSQGDLTARIPVQGRDELAALASSLNEMGERLTRMLQVKADFAANASHELRTPLSSIRAAVETLLDVDMTREAGAARHFLEVIDRQSTRMQAMVGDLLNLSRIETSPDRFRPVEVSIPDLVEEMHTRFGERLGQKGIAWRPSVGDAVGRITVSIDLLRLVLENLIDNAIKFTDRGGSIQVNCRCRIDDGSEELTIEVADTGCGIPEDEQERVFERFYQVTRARSGADRGTGLGLSIVRHAVAAMHGSVRLRSRVGRGTSITVSVPAQSASAPSGFKSERVLAEPKFIES
jgi:signal transduction histidine kinase